MILEVLRGAKDNRTRTYVGIEMRRQDTYYLYFALADIE